MNTEDSATSYFVNFLPYAPIHDKVLIYTNFTRTHQFMERLKLLECRYFVRTMGTLPVLWKLCLYYGYFVRTMGTLTVLWYFARTMVLCPYYGTLPVLWYFARTMVLCPYYGYFVRTMGTLSLLWKLCPYNGYFVLL